MWVHERDAVRWVQQGRPELTQLAADVVLLSNMAYRLRKHDLKAADVAAAENHLPRCLRKNRKRNNITHGRCDCTQLLCKDPNPPELAVLATRARFSENFCLEQARLASESPGRLWTRRGFSALWNSQYLTKFWNDQADKIKAELNGSNAPMVEGKHF
jgi:hypothetical protein